MNEYNTTKTAEKLLKEYRGLRKEDLDQINPEYSCIICRDIICNNHVFRMLM